MSGWHARHAICSAATIAVVALVAASCSSSSKSTSSPTTASGANGSTAGASGTPIVVGNVSNLTNQSLGIQADDSATPKAWVAYTNAHGGIGGHPVKLVQMDDAGDPARALSDVQQLVSQKHVVALVGNQDSATDTAYAKILQQSGVPNVGGADFSTIWNENPDYFPTMATENASAYGLDYAAKYAGAKTFEVAYCKENPACLEDENAERAIAPTVGIKYIKGPAASFVQPNYTAQCEVMINDHPDAIAFAASTQDDEQFATNCAQQDYKGIWVLYQPDDTELKTAALSSAIGYDLQLPYFAQLPATQPFRQAMSKYASGVPLMVDSLRIWAAFDTFKAAVEAEIGQPVTPQTVKAGLYSLQGYTDNGMLPPLHFHPGQPANNPCFLLWGIKNSKFTLPNGDKFVCPKSS